MNENGIRGIEQGRAKFAYDRVNEIVQNPNGDLKKKYKSGAKKLPVLIKTNGLGQALAFIKNRDNFPNLYDQIATWLRSKGLIGTGEMVDLAIVMESGEYRRVTTETLALLNWIRRFVDGLMKEVEEDN
jgi:CRISPR-associated protein Cmr5